MTQIQTPDEPVLATAVSPWVQRLLWRRRTAPISVEQARNAKREAEYVARRNGIKPPLLQIWRPT